MQVDMGGILKSRILSQSLFITTGFEVDMHAGHGR